MRKFVRGQQRGDVGVNRLTILGIVQLQVNNPVSQFSQALGKGSHGRKKCGNLLNVMRDVIRLLADFHQDIGHTLIRVLEPGVICI